MPNDSGVISDRLFYAYAHPLYRRRFHLALVFAIILFPLIAVALVVGTVILIVPLMALLLWMGSRVLFARLLGNSILVSEVNYPRVHALAEDLKTKMAYQKPIYVFVYEQGNFNASMRYLFFRRAIFLNSELLETGVSDEEMRWIIGRFVGYLRARRQTGVLGAVIRAAQHLGVFNIFLLPYERAMVYTGDRLALAAIGGDITSAVSALQKLLVGRQLGYSVNPEGLIDQQRRVKGSFFAFLARVTSAFPHMTARYVDLIVFAKAYFPSQYAKFAAANPDLPELSQLAASARAGVAPPPERLETDARPLRGWVWAGATAVVLVAVVGLAVRGQMAWFGGYGSEPAFSETPAADAPVLDTSAPGAGPAPDATSPDASASDASAPGAVPAADPATPDGSAPDASAPDAAPAADAAPPDGSTPDASAPDAVPPADAASPDASAPSADAPPHIHRDPTGKAWVPDDGCTWATSNPEDLSVTCQ